MPQIEVTFDIDANGIVHVSAKDLGTGKEQSMTITGGSALPKDDIERMMRDAEEHADEDKQRREEAETRNLAEALQCQTEKFLGESGDKLPADEKDEVNEALSDLRSAPRRLRHRARSSRPQEKLAAAPRSSARALRPAGRGRRPARRCRGDAGAGARPARSTATTTSSTPRSSTTRTRQVSRVDAKPR